MVKAAKSDIVGPAVAAENPDGLLGEEFLLGNNCLAVLAALGSTGDTRVEQLPKVPTMKEQGYERLEFTSWFGIVAPAKTPPDVVAKLNADILKVLQSPDGRTKLQEAGFKVTGTSGAQFADIIAADTAKWGKAVAATGFKAD